MSDTFDHASDAALADLDRYLFEQGEAQNKRTAQIRFQRRKLREMREAIGQIHEGGAVQVALVAAHDCLLSMTRMDTQ